MDEKLKDKADMADHADKAEDEVLKHPKEEALSEEGGDEEDILRKDRMPRDLAYICAPYRPTSKDPEKAKAELKDNIRRQALACRTASAFGRIPIAPALYFTRFLRDTVEKERNEGLELGLEFIRYCKDFIIAGDRISEGMRAEIMEASRCGVNIIIWRYPDEPFDSLFREVLKYSKENQGDATGGSDAEDADEPDDKVTEKSEEDKDHE